MSTPVYNSKAMYYPKTINKTNCKSLQLVFVGLEGVLYHLHLKTMQPHASQQSRQ